MKTLDPNTFTEGFILSIFPCCHIVCLCVCVPLISPITVVGHLVGFEFSMIMNYATIKISVCIDNLTQHPSGR